MIEMKSVRGWQRSRLFALVDGTDVSESVETYMAVHDFSSVSSLENIQSSLKLVGPSVVNEECDVFFFVNEFRAEDYRRPSDDIATFTTCQTPGKQPSAPRTIINAI